MVRADKCLSVSGVHGVLAKAWEEVFHICDVFTSTIIVQSTFHCHVLMYIP